MVEKKLDSFVKIDGINGPTFDYTKELIGVFNVDMDTKTPFDSSIIRYINDEKLSYLISLPQGFEFIDTCIGCFGALYAIYIRAYILVQLFSKIEDNTEKSDFDWINILYLEDILLPFLESFDYFLYEDYVWVSKSISNIEINDNVENYIKFLFLNIDSLYDDSRELIDIIKPSMYNDGIDNNLISQKLNQYLSNFRKFISVLNPLIMEDETISDGKDVIGINNIRMIDNLLSSYFKEGMFKEFLYRLTDFKKN